MTLADDIQLDAPTVDRLVAGAVPSFRAEAVVRLAGAGAVFEARSAD
jgi:hypothetical protein